MKKLLLSLAFVLFVVGCNNETTPEPAINYTGDAVLSVGKDGGQLDIAFSANGEWSISSSEPWLTVNPSKGKSGNLIVLATVSANSDFEPRSAVITITSGGVQSNIKVEQSSNETFILSETQFSIGSAGGEIKIPVQANVNYTCSVDDKCKDWISVKQTKSLQNCQIVLSIAQNTTFNERIGYLEVAFEGKYETVTLTQSQQDEVMIGQTDFEIGSKGGEIKVPVSANVEYQATVLGNAGNWLTLKQVQTKGLEEYYMVLGIAENKAYDGRVGQIKISGAGKESVVTVTQRQLDEVLVGHTEFVIGSNGGEIMLPISSNI